MRKLTEMRTPNTHRLIKSHFWALLTSNMLFDVILEALNQHFALFVLKSMRKLLGTLI